MLSETAGHRLGRRIPAGQADGEAALIQREVLTLIIPRPLARGMTEAERRFRIAGMFNLPRSKPALTVQGTGVTGHVRRKLHQPPAELEVAIANAVDVGHEGEARGVQHIFQPVVAFAQYRPGASPPIHSKLAIAPPTEGLSSNRSWPVDKISRDSDTISAPWISERFTGRQLPWG